MLIPPPPTPRIQLSAAADQLRKNIIELQSKLQDALALQAEIESWGPAVTDLAVNEEDWENGIIRCDLPQLNKRCQEFVLRYLSIPSDLVGGGWHEMSVSVDCFFRIGAYVVVPGSEDVGQLTTWSRRSDVGRSKGNKEVTEFRAKDCWTERLQGRGFSGDLVARIEEAVRGLVPR